MSRSQRNKRARKKKGAPWAPICIAVACAGLVILAAKRQSTSPPSERSVGEGQATSAVLHAPGPATDSMVTNRSEFETAEDRVVILVTEGNELLERGEYAQAAGKYEEALRVEKRDEDLHYNLAIALSKLGKIEEAKKHYTEALEIYPEYAEARNNLGNLLMSEKKLDEAIQNFREAIKISPEDPSFHNNLGTAFGRQGKTSEAIVEFTEAVRLRTNYVEARVNLGNALLAVGRTEEAVAELDVALRLQPNFPPAVSALQRARQRQPVDTAPRK